MQASTITVSLGVPALIHMLGSMFQGQFAQIGPFNMAIVPSSRLLHYAKALTRVIQRDSSNNCQAWAMHTCYVWPHQMQ